MSAEEKLIIMRMFVVTRHSLFQTEAKTVLGVHGSRITLLLYHQEAPTHYQIAKSFVWIATKRPAAMADD